VSHDRYFIDKIASKLLIFKGKGVVEESYQNYSEYLSIEKNIDELYEMEKDAKIESSKTKEPSKPKKITKLSYNDQRDLDRLPDIIEKLESKIEEITACLYNPDCYEKRGLSIEAEELQKTEEEYEKISERYLELLELEENLT
jgi:ATP-binding cassette subfamily F protein uup